MAQPFEKIVGRGCYRLFKDGEFVEEASLTDLCKKYDLNYFTVTSAVAKYDGCYRNANGWEMKRHTQMYKVVDTAEKEEYVLNLKDLYDFLGVPHRKKNLNKHLKNSRMARFHVFIMTPEMEEEMKRNG